jgi:peptide/nickel transport system permease protein
VPRSAAKVSTYQVLQLERTEGLTKPVPVQFVIWLLNALKGNLGFSYKLNQTVASLLAHYLPRTLLLVGIATVFNIAIAVPAGMWQGYRRNRRNRPDDHILNASTLILYAMPDFLLGVVFIILLSLDMPLFPSTATAFGSG